MINRRHHHSPSRNFYPHGALEKLSKVFLEKLSCAENETTPSLFFAEHTRLVAKTECAANQKRPQKTSSANYTRARNTP